MTYRTLDISYIDRLLLRTRTGKQTHDTELQYVLHVAFVALDPSAQSGNFHVLYL